MMAVPDEQLTWRSVTLGDVPGLTRLTNAIAERNGGHDLLSEEALADELTSTRWAMAADSLIAVAADGSVAAWGAVPPPPEGGRRLNAHGAVDLSWRGRGLGRRMLSWQIERAGAHHRTAGDSEPWELHIGADDADPSAARLFARFDLKPVRFWFEMQRDVAAPAAPAALADGLRAVPYEPRFEGSLYAAHMEAFSDHWGFQWRPQREWRTRLTGPTFRPRQSVLAVDDADQVAGYVLSMAFQDPSRMTMGTIGTRRAWRRRGVASALMAAALDAYREAGATVASLGVDSANPTGALRVYERMGFAPVLSATTYSRTIG